MEVIIFSTDRERRNRIKALTDKIIADKRLRMMSLHTSSPQNTDELEKVLKQERGYLVIIEITGCGFWEKLISEISEKFRSVKFCIISDSGDAAADAVNLMLDICGYINSSLENCAQIFENVLLKIYSKITAICGGLMTFSGSGELKVIKYSDIYYIETIKQQHLCTVYHKNGIDIIRADISKLIKLLDSRFETTRSSTIANLAYVTKISDRLIYFEDGSCCSVTQKKLGEVKKAMTKHAVI